MSRRNRIKIKKVSPLGMIIRIISFILFVYSIYKFNNEYLFENKYFIYIFIYAIYITYIMIRIVRNSYKLKSKTRFNIIITIAFIITFLLFANGIMNFVLSKNASIKNDIYSMLLILLSISILSIEYAYFILGYKDIKRSLDEKKKNTDINR